MRVGLDHIPLVSLFKWDTLHFMDKAAEFGYEGVLIPGRSLLEDGTYRQQVMENHPLPNLEKLRESIRSGLVSPTTCTHITARSFW